MPLQSFVAGGANLRRLTFHERAARLKALARHLSEAKQELYDASFATRSSAAESRTGTS